MPKKVQNIFHQKQSNLNSQINFSPLNLFKSELKLKSKTKTKFKNMEKDSNLQKDMEQSEQEFRKQFDPTSETFHKGSTASVPIGGQRVPESMSTMYPEGYDPNQKTQVIDYGEEYKKVETDRNTLQNFKKSLAKLCPIVEAFLRHEQIFKDKADFTNEKHVKAHEQTMAKEKINLQKVQEELKEYIPKLDGMDAEGAEMAKQLTVILNESNKKYDSKESLTDFNFKVKKLSTKSFSEANKYLQKLKDIKKNYKKPE